jgi:hypothetical protein
MNSGYDYLRWPEPPTGHPRDYHSWDLVMPYDKLAYAKCMECGQQATPEDALRNREWQERQRAMPPQPRPYVPPTSDLKF